MTGVLLAPTATHAQAAQRLSFNGELGVGTMLPEHQRLNLQYDSAHVQGSVRVGVSVVDALAIQLAASNWWVFSGAGLGHGVLLGGGLRLEPRIGTLGRLFVDGHVGAGVTGEFVRPMFDLGAGFEFAATPWLGVGPALRYAHLFTTEGDVRSDAQLWSLGVSITVRPPAPEPAPRPEDPPAPAPRPGDADGDGVIDPDDLCVNEPAGAHPDPARRGCPVRDSDSDGVLDDADQCVSTPQGPNPDPDRPGCPDGDDDNDGVLNHADQCRAQHQGVHPDPSRPGCPTPDRDNDSVPDPVDHCPDEPGAPHPDPNRNGCPGLVRVEGGQIRINRPVFFATNRDRILPRSFPVLQAVADALRATPDIRKVSVEGHTDSVGNDDRNMDLSQRRAQSVMAWLIQHGIEPGRLEAHGYGETRPIEPNTTREGRAANRRVEFRIVDPPQPDAAPAQ